jgi:hypothetical protein
MHSLFIGPRFIPTLLADLDNTGRRDIALPTLRYLTQDLTLGGLNSLTASGDSEPGLNQQSMSAYVTVDPVCRPSVWRCFVRNGWCVAEPSSASFRRAQLSCEMQVEP